MNELMKTCQILCFKRQWTKDEMCTVILNSFMKLLLSNYYVPNSQLSANNAKMNSLKYL